MQLGGRAVFASREAGMIYIPFAARRFDSAGWSSLVARRAHNPKVTGSNPVPATTNNIKGLDNKSKPFLFVKCFLFPALFPAQI